MTGQVRPWRPRCPGRRSEHEVDGGRGDTYLPSLDPAMFSCFKPQALQPLALGQFLKRCALSFVKDHFSSFKHLQPKSLEHKL